MSPAGIVDLDHVMIGVRSHAEAIAAFERLGFRVRAARPLAPMGGGAAGGTGGSAAVLMRPSADDAANYLELAFFDEPFGAAMMRPILCGVVGGAMLVHATRDAVALHAIWQARGIGLLPLIKVDLPPVFNGGSGQTIRIILPDATHPLFCNACEYADLSEFRSPAMTDHPNGVICFTSAIVVAADGDRDETIAHLSQVYGASPEYEDGVARFAMRDRAVEVVSPEWYAARYPHLAEVAGHAPIRAVRLLAEDLAILGRRFDEARVRFDRSGDGAICVAGADGTAIDLIIHQQQR